MLPSFMNQPFVRERYPMVNDHGTDVVDLEATPTKATFYGSIQPAPAANGGGTVDLINRNGAEILLAIYAQPGSDVTHYDKVTVRGTDYMVNGEPNIWDTGIMDHVEVLLSKWVG